MTDVLYLLGKGRSGSTLLSMALGELDGFFAAGELRFFWRRGLVEDRALKTVYRVRDPGMTPDEEKAVQGNLMDVLWERSSLKHVAKVQLGPALRFGVVTKHGEGEIAAGTVLRCIMFA